MNINSNSQSPSSVNSAEETKELIQEQSQFPTLQNSELLVGQAYDNQLVQNDTLQQSIMQSSNSDDDSYKCYESEMQDGILTEIGNAAADLRRSAISQGKRLNSNFTDLRDSMRIEAHEQAQKARQSFTDAKENMHANIDEFSSKARQKVKKFKEIFIGSKQECNDSGVFEGDYDYIENGYRVNHNTYTSLGSSLFTWHNESVNIWSHIIGVFIFSVLCVVLMVWYEPRQLAFGYELIDHIEANRETIDINEYLTTQIVRVEKETLDLSSSDLTAIGAHELFRQDLVAVMEVSEGAALGMMTYMYTFDYLEGDVILNQLTQRELVEIWRKNLSDHLESVRLSLFVANKLLIENRDIAVGYWTKHNLHFLLTRITDYKVQIEHLGDVLLRKLRPSEPADVNKINNMQAIVAPTFLDAKEIMNETSVLPLTINIFAAVFCMGCSTIYHLLGLKSPQVSANLARLDYAGISILIYGTAVPITYYGYACQDVAWLRHTILNVLGAATFACFVVTMTPMFGHKRFMKMRAMMFVVLGLTAAAGPAIARLYPESTVSINFTEYTVANAIYIAGAIVYVVRFPEYTAPGHYDLCGASHQIWHFCVLAACLVHYTMNYTAFIDRQNMTCPIWAHQ